MKMLHTSKPHNTKSQPSQHQQRDKEAPFIQPKLKIGSPNDRYEREADQMAETVMQRAEISVKPTSVQRKCEDCEEETLQMKTNSGSVPDLQKAATTSSLEQQLQQSKGNGQALSRDTSTAMSQAFGQDFSKVQVHTDSKAIQMNQQLNAKAFTHGNQIYFNKGQYQPNRSEGKRLLAHELTHVVQQGKSSSQHIQRQVNPQANTVPAALIGTPEPTMDPRLITSNSRDNLIVQVAEFRLPLDWQVNMNIPPSTLREWKVGTYQTMHIIEQQNCYRPIEGETTHIINRFQTPVFKRRQGQRRTTLFDFEDTQTLSLVPAHGIVRTSMLDRPGLSSNTHVFRRVPNAELGTQFVEISKSTYFVDFYARAIVEHTPTNRFIPLWLTAWRVEANMFHENPGGSSSFVTTEGNPYVAEIVSSERINGNLMSKSALPPGLIPTSESPIEESWDAHCYPVTR